MVFLSGLLTVKQKDQLRPHMDGAQLQHKDAERRSLETEAASKTHLREKGGSR